MTSIHFSTSSSGRLVGLVMAVFLACGLAKAADLEVGDRIEVEYGYKWIPATVVEVAGDMVRASFVDERQYPPEGTEYFHRSMVRLPGGAANVPEAVARPAGEPTSGGPVRVGDAVEVYYGYAWIPATAVEVDGNSIRATFEDPRQYPPRGTEFFVSANVRHAYGRPVSPSMEATAQPIDGLPAVAAAPPFAASPEALPEKRAEAPVVREPDAVPRRAPAGLLGDWALHIPGAAWLSKTVEDDFARNLQITTHYLNMGGGLSNYGALRISGDGSYSISDGLEKYSGRWIASQREGGGLTLLHPTDAGKNWSVFVDSDGKPQAQCGSCTGLSLKEMTPIRHRDVADYLLTPHDPQKLLAGRWQLYFQKWEEGELTVNRDGTYELFLKEEGRRERGTWQRSDNKLLLIRPGGKPGRFSPSDAGPGIALLEEVTISRLRAVRVE